MNEIVMSPAQITKNKQRHVPTDAWADENEAELIVRIGKYKLLAQSESCYIFLDCNVMIPRIIERTPAVGVHP